MKIDVSEVKKGTILEIDGGLYRVLDTSHMHKGRGSATYSFKIKNITSGQVKEVTYKAGTTLDSAEINYKNGQYLYNTGDTYTFMEFDTSELYDLDSSLIEDIKDYLKENIEVYLMMHNGRVLGIILPDVVTYKVVETTPGVKGDRAQAGTKPAKLETGLLIQVPLYIEEGDEVAINTSTGEFRQRI